MIVIEVQKAGARLCELLKSVEENDETIILCRDGAPVAEIKGVSKEKPNRFTPHPRLTVELSPDFDPIEPATDQDWPPTAR